MSKRDVKLHDVDVAINQFHRYELIRGKKLRHYNIWQLLEEGRSLFQCYIIT